MVRGFRPVWIDRYFVDGIPGAFNWFGGPAPPVATGRAQNYLLILVRGLPILVGHLTWLI